MTAKTFDVRPARAAELYDLRHRMLRQGLPPEAAMFDGDDDPQTLHSAAWSDDGQTIGCGTLVRRPLPDAAEAVPTYQLRGMAVTTGWQKRGVGAAVLRHLESRALAAGAGLLWCNARTPAVPFYQRQGWRISADVEFFIPTAGMHYRMHKAVSHPSPGTPGEAGEGDFRTTKSPRDAMHCPARSLKRPGR